MRKGKIISIIGAFIVITVMLCNMNNEKIYEKKVYYNSPEEIINEIDNNVISAIKNDGSYGELIYLDNFNECLSKRKRIVGPAINYCKIKINDATKETSDEEKKLIINNYLIKTNNIKNYKRPERIDALSFEAKGEGPYYQVDSNETFKIDIVFIDEGEGWVIDGFFISYPNSENTNPEGVNVYGAS
ncbi:MAG: hypothetical protein GX275_00910 [Clostridiales bacterium]|nr:hypothetical protein [Clostridiales bacterium]